MTTDELTAQIEAITGTYCIVENERRYDGRYFTAWVDDTVADARRGFEASSEEAALSGLLNTLSQLYPNRVPAFAVAAE